MPLSFDYGLYQIFLAFYVGATVVLAEGPSYPYQIIELLVKEKITAFPIVPTIVAILSNMRNGDAIKYESLRYITNTGDRLTISMIEKLRSLFPNTDIIKMYGMTECKRATYLPPDQITKRPDSVGIPIPNSQAFILDEAGMEVGPNVVGELVVRGSHVMQGYWNSKDDTERVFKRSDHRVDALLYTGDLFKRDEEGFLYFIGRKDDLLKVKGERVSPKEIENYLDSMPDVIQSAVIGLPDDLYGHLIVAFVIPNDGLQLDPKKILHQCQKNLEPRFIPQEILILEALPTNGHGKVDKNRLIEKSKSIIKASKQQTCLS